MCIRDSAHIQQWLAIDDHPTGWQDTDKDKLIITNSEMGISDLFTISTLKHKLNELCFK